MLASGSPFVFSLQSNSRALATVGGRVLSTVFLMSGENDSFDLNS
jgi:hypothetical protein